MQPAGEIAILRGLLVERTYSHRAVFLRRALRADGRPVPQELRVSITAGTRYASAELRGELNKSARSRAWTTWPRFSAAY